MMPNTDHIVEDMDADQYSFLLCLKEVSFLIVILFFGFSGFSFCVNKINAPNPTQKIDDIIIHDIEIAEVNSNSNTKVSLASMAK